ncbi:hypothetical protein KVR01_011391 [Diaporthe batatas]|uniref:uncharacterized protein n=1 Tax=Diaporthe batatas TaxID=748121 RepID=UPI001D05B392|nr:uncharacterized protein KVR01_011391 [Diaporthe batatas]KAG8158948.1 hypothetical protein KVR01_011391 [Diaporthe batatas]
MRRSESPQLQVCELACPSPRNTGKTQTTTETMQVFRTPNRNHPYRFLSARHDSSPLFYTLPPSAAISYSAPVRAQDTGQDRQTSGLPAGTIIAIVFCVLILTFLVIGVYAFASSRPQSRRDWRSLLGSRSRTYEDAVATTDGDDIEMQAPRHTKQSLLEQQDENQRQHVSHHEQQGQQVQQHEQDHYHGEGAGMGYDDGDDDKEARIEVGTAKVARIRRVPAGSVSITNIGRGKAAAVPVGASQSVRDVFSLPDLAWAETLTTGGGRRPGAMVPISFPPMTGPAPAPARASAPAAGSGTAVPVSSSSGSRSSSVRSKEGLQERSDSRRAVKRKAIREWCARGSGGGLGPYSAAY